MSTTDISVADIQCQEFFRARGPTLILLLVVLPYGFQNLPPITSTISML
jgi:hypothetical protein